MADRIRVLLVEDHTIVRQGLRALLDGVENLEVVGECEDGEAAVEQAAALRPDVVVMDLNLPKQSGIEATAAIVAADPDTRVVVLSMYATEEYIRPALRAGASGYLVKGAGVSELAEAVQRVAAGDAYYGTTVSKVLSREQLSARGLTAREREVLRLVGEGLSSAEIGDKLGLSVKTIEGHRGRVMAKLDAKNVAGLVRHAIRLGLVTP